LIEDYGKCGNACEICRYYKSTCNGCQIENAENPGKYNCLLFNCAVKKDVQSCFSCLDYPCKLSRGISKSYCPIHSINDLASSIT